MVLHQEARDDQRRFCNGIGVGCQKGEKTKRPAERDPVRVGRNLRASRVLLKPQDRS